MFRNIMFSYRKLQQPVKASLWFLICGFMQKGISMLTTPIFTRIMSEVEYGEFAAYNSWFSVLQIIVSLNLAAGVYTRGLVKNEEDQHRFSSSLQGLSTTCILGWVLLYALFHNVVNNLLNMSTILVCALFVDVWAHSAYQFWSNRERVHYRYKKLVVLTLTYVILRPLFGVMAVLLVKPHEQMEMRVIITAFVNFVLFFGLFCGFFKSSKTYFNRKYWGYALKFNIPLIPHYLSQVVLNQSDHIMIRNICGASEAAYYSVAYTLAMVLQMLNTSISSTMNPWIYKSIRDSETKKIGKVSYAILGVIAIANFAIVVVAPELLLILAPSNYQVAMWVIPPVTVSVYYTFLYNLFATFEYYYEKTTYVMIASITGAILNIGLNALLIPKYGFVAAGYTTLFCYILYASAHYYFMRKVCRLHLNGKPIYNPTIIVLIGTALILASAVAMIFYEMPLVRYGFLAILVIASFCSRKRLLQVWKEMK